MATVQNLKKKLQVIRSTQKITQAMKTASTVKYSKLSNLYNGYAQYEKQCSSLYEKYKNEQESEVAQTRKSQVGTGDRSERIRTYNYTQNRVTDHRINLTLMHLDKIVEGDIEEIIESLIAEDERMKMEVEND